MKETPLSILYVISTGNINESISTQRVGTYIIINNYNSIQTRVVESDSFIESVEGRTI